MSKRYLQYLKEKFTGYTRIRGPITAFLLSTSMLAGLFSYAQSPGGVTPAAWYRADAPATLFSDAGNTNVADNEGIQQWNEYQGTGFDLEQASSGRRPVFSDATMLTNFNPTVTFDGSNDWMQFTAGAGVDVIDRADGSLYAAGFMNVQKRSGFLGFHASVDYPGLHIFNNYKLLFFTGGPGYQGVSTDVMQPQSYFTTGAAWLNGGGSASSFAAATVSFNGNRNDYIDAQLSNANLSAGARDLRIGADNNWGAFSGQLNEILVFESKLTPAQMDQVESYLAIKYGTTFASGTKDYKNAAGVTVWDATANAGFHNHIAGIARDDNGALYQKQSWSTNTGQQVLIGVGNLANTNTANAATLTNGQSLIWGDNGLAKVPTVPTTLFAGLSHHFAAVWKVQNNGTVGTVRVAWPKTFSNLTLIQSSDGNIDGADVTTLMDSEVTINGTVYNYADVTLANGSYFTFGAKLAGPGGVVAGLMMWHKADDGTVSPGAKSIWQDVSGLGRDVTQNNNVDYQPTLVTDASYAADSKEYNFNFNPFYYFDGANDFFYRSNQGDYFPDNGSAGSTYGVMYNSSVGGYRTPYGWGDDRPNIARAGNNYQVWRNNGNVINVNVGANNFVAHIGGMSWKGAGTANNGIYMNLDGRIHSNTNANIGTITSNIFQIGSEGWDLNGNGNEVFQGGISEVFAYSVDHENATGDEKQRINSYLAIKYGITLSDDAGTGVPDYLSSNSTVIWDATTDTGYNNNIAGIARDDNSALHQKQSYSNRSGQQVLIGTIGLDNTNADNETTLNEGQFLVWGDNGMAKVPAVSISGVADVNYRFASVWKVQNTGSVGTVRVAWPQGLTNITLLKNATDASFATVDASYPMAGTAVINGVAYNYTDVALNDGDYFTFASQLNGPGGVSLDLRVWLRADAGFTPESWTDFSGNENHFTQAFEARQPFTAAQSYNFNPIVDFGGSASADGRFMSVPNGKPFSANGLSGTFFTATLTRTGGTSGYRDIWGFGATATTASLGNADAPAITKLNNNIVLYSSTASAFSDQYPDNRLLLTDISYSVGVAGIYYGLNGDTASTTQTRTAGNSLQANGSILGSQSQVTNGLIGEAIAYERNLTEEEKIRVRSYIAVKYGITLPHNYVAANGTTVFWDIADNDGYNSNIAGMARDDYGSLYQRQSHSIQPGRQVLISTKGLNSSNGTNAGALADQQFLVWGDNDSAKAPTVPITGISGVNSRFAAIWKVQNTNAVDTVRIAWPQSFANLKLIQSADETITSADAVTDMDGTLTIGDVVYAYADVILTDEQYFTFAAFVQAPGGVTAGLSHWYRADRLVESTGDSTDLTSWTDFTSGVEAAQIGTGALPKFRTGAATYFNYNPGIQFTNTNQKIGNITEPTVSVTDFELFTLTKEGMSGSRFFNIGMDNTTFSGANWDHPGLYANGNIGRRNNTGGSSVINNPGNVDFSSNSPSIMYHRLYDLSMSKGLNGAVVGATYNHSARGLASGGHIFGANNGDVSSGDDGGFTGHIGEVIIYGNGTITTAERNKVDAYLAIKYGITLDTSISYVTSQNDTVWHRSANLPFYHNVAGIGHDFISALHQKQSRSQHDNVNGQVIIALGDIAETNVGNLNEVSDGDFLMWGDNGNTQAMSDVAATYTPFVYAGSADNGRRMNRVWKVENTDVAAEVLIKFPVASVGTTTLTDEACADYVILFADDSTFTSNVLVRPLLVNEDDYDVLHTFPNGYSYFTYARVRPLNAGLVYLPDTTSTTTEYDDECATGDWTYYHQAGNTANNLLAVADYSATDLDNLEITIIPEGIGYDDGARLTNMMARVTTITDTSAGVLPAGKVRIYFSLAERDASTVPGAVTNGWFRYNGDGEAVMTDIYSDGVFEPGTAKALVPDATGEENGVAYVEFHNLDSLGSFVFISSTEVTGVILPVSLTRFSVTKQEDRALLAWATAAEHDNRGFEIERSGDGRNWFNIGFVASKSVSGTSDRPLEYNYFDNQPLNARNYYRLKQIDLDDRYTYSGVRFVDFSSKAAGTIEVMPNPVKGTLRIAGLTGKNSIAIVNVVGQIVWRTSTDNVGEHTINMSAFAPGIYMIHVSSESGVHSVHKIVKE